MNYEEYLKSQNKPHNVEVACPVASCRYKGPAATFGRSGNLWVCSTHYHESRRTAEVSQDAWDLEKGNDVRAKRNELLNRYAWTVTPVLNGALSEANVSAWATYLTELNNLTITYQKPSEVIWPTPPTLVYK